MGFIDSFLRCQKVEQEGGKAFAVHFPGDEPVAGAQAAAAAAVGENDEGFGSGGYRHIAPEDRSRAWDSDFEFPEGGERRVHGIGKDFVTSASPKQGFRGSRLRRYPLPGIRHPTIRESP